MKTVWNATKATVPAIANRVAGILFPGQCFANEAPPANALFVHLRNHLEGGVAEAANEVVPDAEIEGVIVSLGGETKANEFWANAWQGVSMPHEVKSALDGIGASKHRSSLDAHAASKLAANSTTKTGARGDSATADDHADSYEWHDKARQQHSAAAVNNPDMKELHEKVRDWHAGQMASHDEGEEGCLTNSDANARQDQRNKLVTLVGENRMIQPQYGEVPPHINAADHAKRLDGLADSLNDFLGKATHLKRSEKANATTIAEQTKRQAGWLKDAANSSSRFSESNFLRPVRANEMANAKNTVALPMGSTTFPDRAETMKKHGLKIGDKVQADENYGGRKGTVNEFSPSGSHVLVDHDDGGKGWYHAGDLEGCDCADDENSTEEGKANEGTSEGALKGWETRHAGSMTATREAEKLSSDARDGQEWGKDIAKHQAAMEAHKTAADAHEKASVWAYDAGKDDADQRSEELRAHHLRMSEIHHDKIWGIKYKGAKANESLANEGATCEQVSFVNELRSDGNWIQLSPYGDWPHPDGTQRFTKADATNCVNEFNSLANTLNRVMGLPFYIGHPDHPAFKARYTDTKAYGRMKQLEAREDGLWANMKWSQAGKDMVNEEQFHGHSVNWRVRKGADGFWHPFSVKSAGFSNEPNIPVQPITHANEVQDTDVENDLQNEGTSEGAFKGWVTRRGLSGNLPSDHVEAENDDEYHGTYRIVNKLPTGSTGYDLQYKSKKLPKGMQSWESLGHHSTVDAAKNTAAKHHLNKMGWA